MKTEIFLRNRIIFTGSILFFISLVLRLAYVNTMDIPNPIRNDARLYFQLAYNLAHHHSYSLAKFPPYIPTNYITPAYPIFLSWIMMIFDFKNVYFVVLNIQALIGSITVLLIYAISTRVMPATFCVLAGVLTAFSPHLIVTCGYFLTECLFTFIMALSIFFSIFSLSRRRPWQFFITGALCALASLIRPVMFLYPIIIIAILVRFMAWRSTIKPIVSLLIGVALLASPWYIWKTKHVNPNEPRPELQSFALGTYPNLIYKDPKSKGFPYRDDPEWPILTASFNQSLPVITERVKKEPLKYLQWFFIGKPKMFWQANNNVAAPGGPFIYYVENSIYHKPGIPIYSLNFFMHSHFFWVILGAMTSIVCFFYFIKGKIHSSISTYPCAGIVIYFTIVHTILTPLPRYSYPVIPFAYLLACLGLHMLWVKLNRQRQTLSD